MSELNISDPLMQMVFSAAEEGIETLKSEQNLVPFALLLTKEGVVLRRFADEDIAVAIERAQKAVSEADEDTLGYAIVYDVQLKIGGEDVDALMVEAGERGKPDGWRFIQRYKAKIANIPLHSIGDVAYIGTDNNHLS